MVIIKLPFQKIKVERIPNLIVEQIRREIITGKLKPGDYLPPELELAEKFKVSRTSVREALQILEGFGVIERRKREGTIIRQVTIEDLAAIYIPKPEDETMLDLFEARIALECAAVKLAVERASNEEIEELEMTVSWMFRDPKSSAENDIVFHIMLARLSHNQVIANLVQSLKKTMDKIQVIIPSPEDIPKVIEEHRGIVDAIKKRDAELAQQRIIDHIRGVMKNWENLKNKE